MNLKNVFWGYDCIKQSFPTHNYAFICVIMSFISAGGDLTPNGIELVGDDLTCVDFARRRLRGRRFDPDSSQVGFSNSYLCSINKDLWWCSVVEINWTLECSHLMSDLNKKLCWIYGLSYQIKESSFSQKLYYASLGDRLKEGLQWVNCVVLITTLLQHCTFQEYVFNGQSLATMLASSRWSSGQDMGFCGLRMANSKSGYHNFLSSGQVPESLGWS